MKRLVIVSLFLIACLCMNGFIAVPATEIAAQPDASDITPSAAPDADLVLKARLENLLNINYIYGDDILDNEKLLNRSAISLKSLADDNGFIKQEAVVAFKRYRVFCVFSAIILAMVVFPVPEGP